MARATESRSKRPKIQPSQHSGSISANQATAVRLVALLALAALKLVDFLSDAVPAVQKMRSLLTFVVAVGAATKEVLTLIPQAR
jgi:hypothetical protein